MGMFLLRVELSGVSPSHSLHATVRATMERSGFLPTVEDDASGRRVQLPTGTWALERDGLGAAEAHALAAAAVEEALAEDEDGAAVSPALFVCEARRFVWTGLPSPRAPLKLVPAGERAR
jgi:hypothetical protein